MKLFSRLLNSFRDREYRREYVDGFTDAYLATQIRVLREQRKLTQAEMANRVGVRQSQISRWENVDNTAWQVRTLKRMAEAFDLALVVRFESFGQMLPEIAKFGRAALQRASFGDDPVFARVRRQTDVTVSAVVDTNEAGDDDDGAFVKVKTPELRMGTITMERCDERIA